MLRGGEGVAGTDVTEVAGLPSLKLLGVQSAGVGQKLQGTDVSC